MRTELLQYLKKCCSHKQFKVCGGGIYIPGMAYTWQSMSRAHQLWTGGMFMFGTGRSLFADYGKHDELFSQRAVYSVLSGVVFMTPYGVYELYKLANRLEVKVTGRNPEDFPAIYSCGIATNPRVVW